MHLHSLPLLSATPLSTQGERPCPPTSTTANRVCSPATGADRQLLATQQQRKIEILHAFRKGNLVLREITTSDEKKYHANPLKTPKPVYVVIEGTPVEMRDYKNTTIAIMDPEPLCAYKKNASTYQLASGNVQPDELGTKCLPDLSSLRTKMHEQTQRMMWEINPLATSGHLTAEGIYTLPKPRPRTYRTKQQLDHSELVTVKYEKSQIVCYCISNNDIRNLSSILADKHQLEQSLAIENLPFAIYSEQSGSIEIWFENELELSDNIEENEILLDQYARSLAVESEALKKALTLLPWPERLCFINSLQKQYTPPPSGVPTTADLIKLVSTPSEYSAERLRAYFNSGTRIDHNVLYNGKYQPLLLVLLESEYNRLKKSRYWLHTEYDATSLAARALFDELMRCGSRIDPDELSDLVEGKFMCFPHLFDSLVAAGMTLWPKYEYDFSLFYHYPDCPGTTVTHDRQFQTPYFTMIQSQLEGLLINPFSQHWRFPHNYQNLLIMLFYYGGDPRPFEQKLLKTVMAESNKHPDNYKKMCGEQTPKEYVQNIMSLWQNRESNPTFINWPDKVAQAQSAIEALSRSQQPLPQPNNTIEQATMETLGQPLVAAFSHPPQLIHPRDNQQTVLQILHHYYRRPGPERTLRTLGSDKLPNVWKTEHSCSHVLRVRNNVHWYIELLKQFQLFDFCEDEKELLALAAIYHDAAAEDVGKIEEESRSSAYFKRDLANYHSADLVDKVGEALAKKEDDIHGHKEDGLDERLRCYLHVLRFADRMDFIRCSTVSASFPDWNQQEVHAGHFNPDLLDIPLQISRAFSKDPKKQGAFQQALEAAMHGAVDLASVTGGTECDQRPKCYKTEHGLSPDKKQLLYSFEKTPQPVDQMDRFLNDNVRRKIAEWAGIRPCNSEDHATCQADVFKGVSRGIHNSWHDLAQIRIPGKMSVLEKMQCSHNPSLLSESTRVSIRTEIERLKNKGIAMNLGTLTQQTLKSPAVLDVLSDREIDVVSVKCQRGWDGSNKAIFHQMQIPEKRKKITTDCSEDFD